MSGVSLPVTRPSGRALVVGNGPGRAEPLGTLQRMGYGCFEADDPYAAIAELSRRPMVYRSLILSLSSLHREELAVIPTVKRRYPHVEVWLTHTDGRQASLAEAMRLGADGLLSGEGLHRIALAPATTPAAYPAADILDAPYPRPPLAPQPVTVPRDEPPGPPTDAAPASDVAGGVHDDDEPNTIGEPVLTVDELRALLQEQPLPPSPANEG